MNDHFNSSPVKIIEINAKLCWAFFLSYAAYLIWPEHLVDYGWVLLALMMGAAAFGLVINAIRLMIRREEFERKQKEFQEQGNQVKSAKFPSKDFLTEKGIIRK